MDPYENTKPAERLLLAAIEHDRTRIWLVHGEATTPVSVVERPTNVLMHVRGGQERHLHGSEAKESEYFAMISKELSAASHVILYGHGTGRSNAMAQYVDFVKSRDPRLWSRFLIGDKVDFSSLSDGELIALAKKLWSRQ